jgi:hypothetical protein
MISIENIQLVEYDLQSAGIDYLPLKQELVDHICMDVEREIEKGRSFDLAYQNIKHQYIDNTNLIKVQSDAKNILDYKSIFLKRLLIAISIITIIGFWLKTFKISGSNCVQFISMLLIGILFYKVGFYLFQDKRQKGLKVVCSMSLFIVGFFLPTAYFIFSFLPSVHVIATKLNMISYLLLSLSLTIYFSSNTGLNIFGINAETRKTDLLIATINLSLAILSNILSLGNYSGGLKYLLFVIIGLNLFLAIYYLLIKQKFKNKLISLLIISAIIIHLYHLPIFIRGIFEK